MKRWSFTTLLIIVLTLLPMSQIEWNTEAEASQTSKVSNEVISNSASPKKAVKEKASVSTTGFMPKVNRSYTYKPSFEDAGKKTYTAYENKSIENSVELLEDDYIGYTYIEDEQQLALGVAYSDIFFFSLGYPMKEKTTITDTDYLYDGTTETTPVYVESTSATVQTKAGTFRNVVVLKYPNGSKIYLAKDYGIIRITDYEGTITTELISVK